MSGEDVAIKGFLNKLGYENPNWTRRFFVLSKNEVRYYSNDRDYKAGKKEKGLFFLDFLSRNKIKTLETGATLNSSNALAPKHSKVVLPKKYQHLIQIGDCRWHDNELRTFIVSCEKPEDRDEWIKTLKLNLEIYLQTPESKNDQTKVPSEGPRKEAYNIWVDEQKKLEQEALERDRKEREAKTRAMKEEPWYQVHTLCSKGTLDDLKSAVAKKEVDIYLKNPNGGSTLLQAATYGNVEIMRYLIEQGIDINGASNGGNTALHAAACMGFYDAAKLLLEKGADRSLTNRETKTAGQSAKK